MLKQFLGALEFPLQTMDVGSAVSNGRWLISHKSTNVIQQGFHCSLHIHSEYLRVHMQQATQVTQKPRQLNVQTKAK